MRPILITLSPAIAVLLVLLCCPRSADARNGSSDLTSLSLEQLMQMEVYSPTRKPQQLLRTAAAVTIITPEDIRRSGATNIPDLLRMVPGVVVQQLDSNSWDISSRGFNGSIFANKLLVLIDGRAVYTPLYGGVFWDVQDVVLEDIERIEVIRGPGGTIWGANAVNGVVNIITKRAEDTQGTMVSAGAGSEERGFGTLRHGGHTNDWFYRGYGKYFNREDNFRPGSDIDEWDMARGGFRADKENWTFQGDFYDGDIGQQYSTIHFTEPFRRTENDPMPVRGWNLLGRHEQEDQLIQLYWDVTERNARILNERREKIDLEYIRHVLLSEQQVLSWGAGYRLEREHISNTQTVAIHEPSERMDQLFHFFVQDEFNWMDERLRFTVGTKFEHNIYTGAEIQPNVRLLYEIDHDNVVWTAVSRAVRTPSRLEWDGELSSILSGDLVRTIPNHDLVSEELIAYELGYRHQPRHDILLDFVLFAHHYDDIITYTSGETETIQGQSVLRLPAVNGMSGEVHGGSVSAEAQLKSWWRIKGYYSLIKMDLHTDADIVNIGLDEALEDAVPRHAAYIRSSFDLPWEFELDTTIRYMDSISDGDVPSYTELDIVLGKELLGWDVSLVGRNLIEEHHKESTGSTEVERSGYLKVTREF